MKDLGWCDRNLIKVLSLYVLGGTEKTHEKPQNNLCRDQDTSQATPTARPFFSVFIFSLDGNPMFAITVVCLLQRIGSISFNASTLLRGLNIFWGIFRLLFMERENNMKRTYGHS